MTRQQFIEMVSREQESLRRFLRGLCGGDGFLADDMAQEALLKAYLSFERFEGRARFSTWLFRIAYNCYVDHHKASDTNGAHFEAYSRDSYGIEDESVKADRTFEYQPLYESMAALGFSERAVTLLFYMEDKSIKEIAAIMDMPSGTVRSHLSRARRRMKAYLNTI